MIKKLYEEEDFVGGGRNNNTAEYILQRYQPTINRNSDLGQNMLDAMNEYAKEICKEQRRLLHETLNKMVSYDNESEKSNFIIEIMSKTEYPKAIYNL